MRLFRTEAHPCSYYPDRRAVMSVLDPKDPALADRYGAALAHGFRRTGGILYRPMCGACRACVSTRLFVPQFKADRSQRRSLSRNRDIDVVWTDPVVGDEHRELYRRYLHTRHDGENEESDPFANLVAPFPTTLFMEARLDGRLVALAITDLVEDGLSAVYTAYETTLGRSLGTFSILQQVERARRLGLPFVYLGFWLDGHPQMDYKRRFRPQQRLIDGRWVNL
jgi:arginine-tRNA-protein transferase